MAKGSNDKDYSTVQHRQDIIMDILEVSKEKNPVNLKKLSIKLGVCNNTIRSDLAYLADMKGLEYEMRRGPYGGIVFIGRRKHKDHYYNVDELKRFISRALREKDEKEKREFVKDIAYRCDKEGLPFVSLYQWYKRQDSF